MNSSNAQEEQGTMDSSTATKPNTRRSSRETDSTATGPPPIDPEQLRESQQVQDAASKKSKKESWFVRHLKSIRAELDNRTLMQMAKAGLAPAIVLALFEIDAIANYFSSQGYLAAIISIIHGTSPPRARYIETTAIALMAVSIGAAFNLFAMWTALQARLHSSTPTATYSSSASAVCGVWLFFQVYIVQSLRSNYKMYTPITVMTMIEAIVSMSYGPTFMSISQVTSFAERLYVSFLYGIGLAAVVSLLVFPFSSRQVVFHDIERYLRALDKSMQATSAYFQSLEKVDMFSRVATMAGGKSGRSPEATAIKNATGSVAAIHGKLDGDLPFAKREFAYGWMGPKHIKEVGRQLRAIMLPLLGLSSLVDVFETIAESSGFYNVLEDGHDPAAEILRKKRLIADWNDLMKLTHGPFQSLLSAMRDGVTHVLIKLRMMKLPKATNDGSDAEMGAHKRPGGKGFAQHLEQKSDEFLRGKEAMIRKWCEQKGLVLPDDFFENPNSETILLPQGDDIQARYRHEDQYQRELYFVLYLRFLIFHTSRSLLELVKFVDSCADSNKTRIIVPGRKSVQKWISSILRNDQSVEHDHSGYGDYHGTQRIIRVGLAFDERKDPEHLPPQNWRQTLGEYLRVVPTLARSSHSTFGLRTACAVMCVSIVVYLEDTQQWFVLHRGFWAGIMVCISINPTAGSSLFSYILRIAGTIVAAILAFAVWYIPDQKTPGVIVLLWFCVALLEFILLKRLPLVVVGVLSKVTLTLIVGYTLEAQKLGPQAVQSNGQEYLPIYLLAPYRLLTVLAGLGIAFFWTFFPYAITERSELRQILSASLYLLANYNSIVHETIKSRLRGDPQDESIKGSAAQQLAKVRYRVYAKNAMLISGAKGLFQFLPYDLQLGGTFPKSAYADIIRCLDNALSYLTLASYAARSLVDDYDVADPRAHFKPEHDIETANQEEKESVPNPRRLPPDRQKWISSLRTTLTDAQPTSHEVTSLLSLLSFSVRYGQPLPPYLTVPARYRLSERLRAVDAELLSVKHFLEPGYSSLAVMQVSTRCVLDELQKLLETVKELVGELDFSFHVISTGDAESREESKEALVDDEGLRKRR